MPKVEGFNNETMAYLKLIGFKLVDRASTTIYGGTRFTLIVRDYPSPIHYKDCYGCIGPDSHAYLFYDASPYSQQGSKLCYFGVCNYRKSPKKLISMLLALKEKEHA